MIKVIKVIDVDTELEYIFDLVDMLCHNQDLEILDWLLTKVSFDGPNSPIDITLGWLTATLPVKHRLSYRKILYQNMLCELNKRGYTDVQIQELMKGLE